MAKYDWEQLEKEYMLSTYNSVSSFLKDKGISNSSGGAKKATKGWKEKKAQKEHQKGTKIIQKTTEKEIQKEVEQIINIKTMANDLAFNLVQANKELNLYMDFKNSKIRKGLINTKNLKQLTSALKDLNDILEPKQEPNNGQSLADTIQKAYENKVGDR